MKRRVVITGMGAVTDRKYGTGVLGRNRGGTVGIGGSANLIREAYQVKLAAEAVDARKRMDLNLQNGWNCFHNMQLPPEKHLKMRDCIWKRKTRTAWGRSSVRGSEVCRRQKGNMGKYWSADRRSIR